MFATLQGIMAVAEAGSALELNGRGPRYCMYWLSSCRRDYGCPNRPSRHCQLYQGTFDVDELVPITDGGIRIGVDDIICERLAPAIS